MDVEDADRRILGCAREDVVGHPIADTLTDHGKLLLEEMATRRRGAEAAGDKGRAMRFEVPQRCKNGGEVWSEILTMPLYDPDGRIVGFQGVGRDITDRKRKEAELTSSQQALESQLRDAEKQTSDLREQSIRDPLTGLFNRRYLNETLPRELARGHSVELGTAQVEALRTGPCPTRGLPGGGQHDRPGPFQTRQ